jgi:hypothetical protein
MIQPRRQQVQRSQGRWRRLIVAATALLILSPMFFLDVSSPTPELLRASNNDAKVLSLPAQPEPDSASALTAVYDWLHIGDPTIFILPDVAMGFARFRAQPQHQFRAALPSNIWEPAAATPLEQPALQLPIRQESLSSLLAEQWPQERKDLVSAPPAGQAPSGIFWRDSHGRQVIDPPIIQPDFIDQAIANHGLPQQMTLLEIVATPYLPMPRIVIRQSCGNVRLDELLLNAIRDYFQRQPFAPTSSTAGRKHSLLLEIDWRLPLTRS